MKIDDRLGRLANFTYPAPLTHLQTPRKITQSLLHKAVYFVEMTAIAGKTTEYSERPYFRGDRLPFANVLSTKTGKYRKLQTFDHRELRTRSEGHRTVKESSDPNAQRPVLRVFIGHMFLVCAAFFDT